ncbi:MAG: Zn-ribbon containing protein, partial [Nanoarchaeota archaeon]
EVLNIKEEENQPVVLDLESIRVVKPGKFELDLVHLFKKDPLIIKLEEGKYMIDLPMAFKKMREDNDEKEKK